MDAQAPSSEERWDDFGNALRKHRKARALSQPNLMDELARHCIEVASQGTISKWESGKQRPNPETAEVLEDIFNLPRGTLLHLLRYPVEEGSATQEKSTNWIEDHVNEHGSLPELLEQLRPLVSGYSAGEPISKRMKPVPLSMQHWNRLPPSVQDQLHVLLRWLGIDPRDYHKEMLSLAAPNGGRTHLTFRPPGPR
jgi:transcriptional regulator with XRE-family HTH domain